MASTSTAISEATPPNRALILFARGVIARLEFWPALRIAVEQGWGGPSSREKRRWLASEIVDAFDNDSGDGDGDGDVSLPDAEYVALMLAQVLEDEFDATFEDGSVEAVAEDIVALWGAGEDVVGMWERKAESGEEGEEEAPRLVPAAAAEVQRPARPKPIIDEDGFTLVTKKGTMKE